MARLSLYFLGSFNATLDGKPLTGFESNKVRALLAYLAVEAGLEGAGRSFTRDALIGLLWPDCPDRAARRNLSQALFNLRQVLHDDANSPPFLDIARETIGLNPESDYWLDVTEFERKIQEADRTMQDADRKIQEHCALLLASGVELYRGEFLAGFFVDSSVPFAEWASLLRERLHRQVLEALYRLAAYSEQLRDYQQAQHYARRQVELEPWREEAHYQLMRLFVRSGQRSAALAQYEMCRRTLADELGVEPSEPTQRLYRRIRSVNEIGAHNLPPQMTPFVGREAECRELAQRLAQPACRLLSLVGPGGIGKTRLALQVAYENRNAFLHGVCFVPLAAVQSPMWLLSAIADALHLHSTGQADLKASLLDVLREREMLLVLDNFEQLVETGGDLLLDILSVAPEVKLLVTTRERLHLYGETVFEVTGLNVPGETETTDVVGYDAVAFFLQCADRMRAGFAPSSDEWAAIVRICRLVEGMPLGIELAAASVQAFSCQEIAAQMAQSLAFLSTTLRGVPARHCSVRAAFDASWQRLSADEQRVFASLSVFRGGFDSTAAAKSVGASPLLLARLGDRSFISRASTGRYTLHELLHQYAAEKLAADPGEMYRVQEAHCACYADFVHDCYERFLAGEQREALDAIERDIENVCAAWSWAIEQGRYPRIAQMLDGLYTFYFERGGVAGDALFEAAASALEKTVAGQANPAVEDYRLWAGLLWRWSQFHYQQRTDYEGSAALAQKSVTLLRTLSIPLELSGALCALGTVLRDLGRYHESRQCLEESVVLLRSPGEHATKAYRHQLARSLTALSLTMGVMKEYAGARCLLQESLAVCRESGNLIGVADNLNTLGGIAYRAGEYGEAKRYYIESQAAYETLGEVGWANVVRNNLGHACLELGEYAEASRHLRASLKTGVALFQGRFLLNILHGLAELFEKQGDTVRAFELATFVVHNPLSYRENVKLAQQMADALAAQLSPEVVATAGVRARAWSLEDVLMDLEAMPE